MESPQDSTPKWFEVEDVHRQMAKEYLKAMDEWVCNKTMQKALSSIAKGQLDIEKVNRAKAEKELRDLQKENKELDRITELAKEIMKQQGNKDVGVDNSDITNS